MLGKGLQLCCSRLKRPSSSTPKNTHNTLDNTSAAAAATSSASSTSSSAAVAEVYKNFNSLYDPTSDADIPTGSTSQALTLSSFATADSSSSSSDDSAAAPDLSTAIASRRFFAAVPGRSNSIVDSAAVAVGCAGAGVAVPTYSPDPYWDFRRSMEEMMASLGLDPRSHRAHLHELLLCYLALNRKHAHKYIVGAFADLLAAASATTDAA